MSEMLIPELKWLWRGQQHKQPIEGICLSKHYLFVNGDCIETSLVCLKMISRVTLFGTKRTMNYKFCTFVADRASHVPTNIIFHQRPWLRFLLAYSVVISFISLPWSFLKFFPSTHSPKSWRVVKCVCDNRYLCTFLCQTCI